MVDELPNQTDVDALQTRAIVINFSLPLHLCLRPHLPFCESHSDHLLNDCLWNWNCADTMKIARSMRNNNSLCRNSATKFFDFWTFCTQMLWLFVSICKWHIRTLLHNVCVRIVISFRFIYFLLPGRSLSCSRLLYCENKAAPAETERKKTTSTQYLIGHQIEWKETQAEVNQIKRSKKRTNEWMNVCECDRYTVRK